MSEVLSPHKLLCYLLLVLCKSEPKLLQMVQIAFYTGLCANRGDYSNHGPAIENGDKVDPRVVT